MNYNMQSCNVTCAFHNMSDCVVSDVQTRAESLSCMSDTTFSLVF